jgi:hypothetical protein
MFEAGELGSTISKEQIQSAIAPDVFLRLAKVRPGVVWLRLRTLSD